MAPVFYREPSFFRKDIMTKAELVRELAEEHELPRKQVAEMIEAMLEKMTDVLKSGDKVQLAPFGQFKIRDRAARMGRNPATGEAIKIAAKRVLKFTAGKPLKDAVASKRPGSAAAKPAAKKTAAKKTAPAKKTAAKKAPAKKAAPAKKKTAAKKTSRR
jgi:DNA-binding protein HU-beta